MTAEGTDPGYSSTGRCPRKEFADVAQMVEQPPCKRTVRGSIPRDGTRIVVCEQYRILRGANSDEEAGSIPAHGFKYEDDYEQT